MPAAILELESEMPVDEPLETFNERLAVETEFTAFMVALPAAFAVTTPLLSTVATLVLELVQVAPFPFVCGTAYLQLTYIEAVLTRNFSVPVPSVTFTRQVEAPFEV